MVSSVDFLYTWSLVSAVKMQSSTCNIFAGKWNFRGHQFYHWRTDHFSGPLSDNYAGTFTDYTQYGTARTYFYRWNLSSSGNVACLPKTSSSAEQNPASRRMHCQLSDPCICCRCLSSGYYFRQLFWYCRKSFPKKAPYLSFYAAFQYDPVSDPHVCLEHLL